VREYFPQLGGRGHQADTEQGNDRSSLHCGDRPHRHIRISGGGSEMWPYSQGALPVLDSEQHAQGSGLLRVKIHAIQICTPAGPTIPLILYFLNKVS
jgi:hypothetical protein